MPQDLFLVLAIVFGVGSVIINCPFLKSMYDKKPVRAVILKSLASLSFILAGVFAWQYKGVSLYQTIIIFALCFGLLGDVLLGLRYVFKKQEMHLFVIGATAFGFEHFLFIGYFLIKTNVNLFIALLLFAIFTAAAVYVFLKKKLGGGMLKIGIYAYIITVAFMAAITVANMITGFSLKTALFALGGVFFLVSDIILCVYNFSDDKRFKLSIILHFLYFTAQSVIALSIAC